MPLFLGMWLANERWHTMDTQGKQEKTIWEIASYAYVLLARHAIRGKGTKDNLLQCSPHFSLYLLPFTTHSPNSWNKLPQNIMTSKLAVFAILDSWWPASDKCLDSTSQLQGSYTKRDASKINQARHLVITSWKNQEGHVQTWTLNPTHVELHQNKASCKKKTPFLNLSQWRWNHST